MIGRKWKSRRGETLVETLLSLLLSSLALTMLAGAIGKSVTMINHSVEVMSAYTEKTNALNEPQSVTSGDVADLQTELSEQLRSPVRLTTSGGATVTITLDGYSESIQVQNVAYILDYTKTDAPVISYVKSGS